MLRCREIIDQANDHIDGLLPVGARLQMALHLLLCGRCHRFVSQMRLVVTVLGTTQEEPLSSDRAADLASAAMAANRTSENTKEE